jgi:polyisoprenoid-binding protein YceI
MSIRVPVGSVLAVVLTLLLTPEAAWSERYEIVPDVEGTEVVFHSKATMESFEGSTRTAEGWIDCDPDSLQNGVAWNVRVDLRTLDTGIGLRNRHMRENHLHTDEHPWVTFTGRTSAASSLVAREEVELAVDGSLSLHGVTVERSIPVRARLLPDGALEIRSEFRVSLEDHEIPRPKFLLLKLADEQRITLQLLARPVDQQP